MPVSIGGNGPITGVTSINTTVTDTELGYLDGVTSAIQTQFGSRPVASGSFTPALYAITVGNGTLIGRYARSGNVVTVYIGLALGSTSSISQDARFDPAALPVPPNANYTVVGSTAYIDASAGPTFYTGGMFAGYFMHPSGTYGRINSSAPFTWTTNDAIHCSFSYEAA